VWRGDDEREARGDVAREARGDVAREGGLTRPVFRALFGGPHLTLIYNCAGGGASIATLAQLLLELYDVKLAGFRALPTTWWLGLGPADAATLTAMERVEYRVGDARGELGLPATLPPRAAEYAQVPAAFDPDTQMADAGPTRGWAAYCDGYLCMSAATHYCAYCRQHICSACAERDHQEHAGL